MIRLVTRAATVVLLTLLFLHPAAARAGDKEGPSSKEVKQMIKFGVSLGKQGLWKEALYRWREALRHDPDNPVLYNNIAVALESQGDLEGARESYRRAEELAGRAKYLKRNIENFEELFTALEQYEAEYRKPPAGAPEEEAAAAASDGDAGSGETPADGPAGDEAGTGTEAEPVEPPATESAPAADEPEPESETPADDQPVEEVE